MTENQWKPKAGEDIIIALSCRASSSSSIPLDVTKESTSSKDFMRQRQRPLDKPEALERSRSNGSDSGSIPERSLSGNLDTNSLLSEFTEYLRLSFPTLPPLLLAPRIGVFRSVPDLATGTGGNFPNLQILALLSIDHLQMYALNYVPTLGLE
ncbi:hypothetical protein CFP56_004781 [Quercus suber]|uniref:Uncharacterized protein n=1 Tax=Quercus suber TaxID=58331 RepID=A0AAW0M7M7_QUESU